MILPVSRRQISAHSREEETVITQDCGLERTKIHKLTEHAEQEMFASNHEHILNFSQKKGKKKKKNEKCLYNLPEP